MSAAAKKSDEQPPVTPQWVRAVAIAFLGWLAVSSVDVQSRLLRVENDVQWIRTTLERSSK